MNQIIQLFTDSNARMRRLMKAIEGVNKPDMAVIAAAQRDAEVQLKAINAIATLFAVTSKNRRAALALERQGIMDETTAIDFLDGKGETDKVKCPEHEMPITREECLDFSGHHYEECRGCEIGLATKTMLLPLLAGEV